MTQAYTSARFWRCALQVNPEGYSRAYRGQDHGLTGQAFLDALVDACKDNGIQVVGLADHGSVQDVDRIRDALSAHGIVVFPGFEVASTEKVHWVCLFPEDTTTEMLNRYLGSLKLTDPRDGVRPSSLGGTELLEIVEECGGFCYAAHATQAHGILKQKAHHLWTLPLLKAAQIPGSVGELPPEFKPIAQNQNRYYRRDRPMAFINARDVAQPSDLAEPGASCFIKMTRPTFDAFVTAFKDPESRVRLNSQMGEHHYSRIEALSITGGYLDGLKTGFSDHLNTAIGGRGTGKSTLLECLRYALDLEHKGPEARKQGDRIVKENLGPGGSITVTLVSATNQGARYKVVRRYGEPPRVHDPDGNVSTLHPSRDLLPGIELYGQNEIFELARDESALVRVLSRFMPQDDADRARRLGEVRKRLAGNATQLEQALSGQDELEQDLARLPKLNEQAAQYKALGIEEKLKQLPLLEKERQLKPRLGEEITRVDEAVQALREALPDLVFLSDSALDGLPHADILRKGRDLLDALKAAGTEAVTKLNAALEQARTGLDALGTELDSVLEDAEKALETEFAKLPDVAGKRGPEVGRAYQALLRQIEQIQPKQARLTTARDLTKALQQDRRNLLAELSDLRGQRTGGLLDVAKRLSRKLSGKIKVQVLAGGNRQALKTWLCALPGISEKRAAWVDEAEDLTVPALVQAIRSGEEALRANGWGITAGMAETLCKLSERQLMELEVIDLDDRVDLELNVSHEGDRRAEYRPLHKLSTGQQCTAILHLLLLENVDPLIMDQPEDNLDNAFIAERIVTELREAKTERQFIFATHNANIPVFGDAEWIGVFSADEDHGTLGEDAQGSIDVPVIRDQAARILEGGKDAFLQRQDKYGY